MSVCTLLMRCAGPLQSWGSRSRFSDRDTEREPTKSGILGLVAAALGRLRTEPLEDLVALKMGIRADREGILVRDYHTALDVRKSDPKAGHGTVVTNRYYLSDAVFLVGLEGTNITLLEGIEQALAIPHWPLFLGRKACVPSEPVHLVDGMRHGEDLRTALTKYPRLAPPSLEIEVGMARLVMEIGFDGEVRMDVPVSFASDARQFGPRWVAVEFVSIPASSLEMEVETCS